MSDSRWPCQCPGSVAQDTIERILRDSDAAARMDIDTEKLETLFELRLASVNVEPEKDFTHLCCKHIRKVVSHCGLKSSKPTEVNLLNLYL